MNPESPGENQVIDVKNILKEGGEDAKIITTYFEQNLHLTNPLREKLIDLVLKEKRKLSRAMLSNIADQICMIFPGELKVLYSVFNVFVI